MKTKKINIESLKNYFNKNDVDFIVDENPTESRIKLIKDAIRKKDALIKASKTTYQISLD